MPKSPEGEYKPSAREIKQAENTMTEKQSELSSMRLERSKSKKGLEGRLTYSLRMFSGELMGIINGHEIQINMYSEGSHGVYSNIDGVYLTEPEAQAFISKYAEIIDKVKKMESQTLEYDSDQEMQAKEIDATEEIEEYNEEIKKRKLEKKKELIRKDLGF